MTVQSFFGYRTNETRSWFVQATYIHCDGYPTHMGHTWYRLAQLPHYRHNLSALVEYFILANPIGWYVIDADRDLNQPPISPEEEKARIMQWQQTHARLQEQDYDLYWSRFYAFRTTLPLVSYRARNWEALEAIQAPRSYERYLPALRRLNQTRDPALSDWLKRELRISAADLARLCRATAHTEPEHVITPETLHEWPVFEWGYVLDTDQRTLSIYCYDAQWIQLDTVSLDAPEPNWESLSHGTVLGI